MEDIENINPDEEYTINFLEEFLIKKNNEQNQPENKFKQPIDLNFIDRSYYEKVEPNEPEILLRMYNKGTLTEDSFNKLFENNKHGEYRINISGSRYEKLRGRLYKIIGDLNINYKYKKYEIEPDGDQRTLIFRRR